MIIPFQPIYARVAYHSLSLENRLKRDVLLVMFYSVLTGLFRLVCQHKSSKNKEAKKRPVSKAPVKNR